MKLENSIICTAGECNPFTRVAVVTYGDGNAKRYPVNMGERAPGVEEQRNGDHNRSQHGKV